MVSLQQFVTDYASEHNTTKEAIAKQANIGRTSFYSKIRGSSDLYLSEACRLAAVLNCTLEELYEMHQASITALNLGA